MKLPVLICDDSRLARRQMARSLPQGWDVELSFAENGAEAIDMIHQGRADLLFLDLNMPVMNGYEVLDLIRSDDLPTMVLVVSGDIQAEARSRVMAKGALDFIQKPVICSKPLFNYPYPKCSSVNISTSTAISLMLMAGC